jgi:hypothetical protein
MNEINDDCTSKETFQGNALLKKSDFGADCCVEG